MKFSAVLLDIEGTVTSISFVKDVLFPYAYDTVENFVRNHFNDASVVKVIEDLRRVSEEESRTDSHIRLVRSSEDDCISDVAHNVRHWIKTDKKITAMKELQGFVWEEAYRKGEVKGHVYPDVFPILQSLTVPIHIYSSGSVHAQKLLFAHTVVGDMTKIIAGYFDTTIGYKGESMSYTRISETINLSPADILFLTDVEIEARAAREAGLQVMLVIRDGNAPLTPEAKRDFITIHSLEEIV